MTFARGAYHFFFGLFSILPVRFIFLMGDGLISLGFLSVRRMRKIAKESLTIAFEKEKSENEIDQLLRSSFFNLFKGALETLCYAQRPKLLLKKLHLTPGSRENLENALKENKGVLAISAHFGNFPLMLLYLSKLGYPLHAIIRPSPDKTIERSFQLRRSQMGLKTILSYPRKTCVQQSLKALRAKEIVMILMDQHTGSKSGVLVDFFGRKARTPTGAVVFAMRTGSPILPVFTLRDGEDSHKIIIEPHFYLENKSTDGETLQYNVQKITNIIERYIRKYPKEWVWMHQRWKSSRL